MQTNIFDTFRTRRKQIFVVITLLLAGLIVVIVGIGYYHKENLTNSLEYFKQSNTLLNITNFRYILNPGNICSVKFKEGRKSILTVVHSSRMNFISRQIVRRTYGSVHTYDGWDNLVVFSVGMAPPKEDDMIEDLLHREADKHGDIIMGNFIDSYRNLSYKHLMGYKWATEFCLDANYYLKTDDDSMVDIFHAIEFVSNTPRMTKDYYCVLFSGAAPVFNERSKWEVTREEYAANLYPDYCGFATYIVGVGTLKKILGVSLKEKYLFIDDVFVSGMLRSHFNQEENVTENKINIIESKAWSLGADNRKGYEAIVLKKVLFNVIEEMRLPSRSCWVWDFILKVRELSNIYPSTCNSLA